MSIKRLIGVFTFILVCSTIVVGQTTFHLSDTTLTIGESVLIPVEMDVDASEDVLGIQLNINYNTEILSFIGAVKSGSISENITTAVNEKDGSILISMAAINPLIESGDLIFLEFTALSVGTSDLSIIEYRVNEKDEIFPDEVALIKVFDVSGNQSPTAVQIPDTLTFFSGDTLRVLIDESLFFDPEDNFSDLSLTFSIDPLVVIPSFNPVTGLLTVTTLDYVGFATLSVRVEDLDGGVLEFSIVLDIRVPVSNEEALHKPSEFVLYQNYPNPFNPSTNIFYRLPQAGNVLLEVYSMNGQRIAILVNSVQAAGSHTVRFDASGLSSGIYLYRMTAEDISLSRKMMLIK
jgi:hypothetical protein